MGRKDSDDKGLSGNAKMKCMSKTDTSLSRSNSISSCYARSATISCSMPLDTNAKIAATLATRNATKKSSPSASPNPIQEYVSVLS